MSNNRDSDAEYDARYKKFQEHRDDVVRRGIENVRNMRQDVVETGNMMDEDNRKLDKINRYADEVERTASRNNNKMERYLQRTSNCKLYVIVAVELLIFLILMSL